MQAAVRFRAGHFLVPLTQLFGGGALFGAQHLLGDPTDLYGIHIAHYTQHHIFRGVEGPVTDLQNLGRNLAQAFPGAQNGDADGVAAVHLGHEIFKIPAVRGVLAHSDLLIDDAVLPADAFLGEVGGGHKFHQKPQILFKILRAGEIVGRHVIAGEGVDIGAQGGEFRRHIPARQLEHFMFQKMGNAGGNVVLPAVQTKIPVDGAEIRGKIGKLPGKPRLWNHQDIQPAGQGFGVQGLVQTLAVGMFHASTPFRKKSEWKERSLAASTSSPLVTASTARR